MMKQASTRLFLTLDSEDKETTERQEGAVIITTVGQSPHI